MSKSYGVDVSRYHGVDAEVSEQLITRKESAMDALILSLQRLINEYRVPIEGMEMRLMAFGMPVEGVPLEDNEAREEDRSKLEHIHFLLRILQNLAMRMERLNTQLGRVL